MSPAEIAHRVVQRAAMQLEAIQPVLPPPLPRLQGAAVRWIACPGRAAPEARFPEVAAYVSVAERVLQGRFDVFAMRDVALGFPPNWLRDCRTGRVAPLAFGKTLNYRDESVVGNIKYLWEPSRHLEVVTLAQAWHLTRDVRFAQGLRALVQSWIEQNPYPCGPHWTSSLEHGVRLLNWAVAWQLMEGSRLFEGASGEHFRAQWLQSVFRHLEFIAGHRSRHSSANNHLLGELMGLLVGSLAWPWWPQSERWATLAQTEFEEQALLQNAPDGVNREQAFWYHHEVADMMLIAGLAVRAAGRDFGHQYWRRLESMLVFIAALLDTAGRMPTFGDADDAVMLRLSQERGFNVYRSLLATGAVIFCRGDFARIAGHFDDKSRWLLGVEGEAEFRRLLQQPVSGDGLPRAFPDGGYWVLGNRLGEPDELRLIADAGPLGYLSIAAHGHADALSFTLSLAGREMLIDPGTYAYHTEHRWRDYFRGTSAHNTVRVDGLDQSASGGNFIWLRHAEAQCEHYHADRSGARWVASHDGYRRLPDPVTCRREIRVCAATDTVEVTDTIEAKHSHDVEVHWHFSEDCTVQLDGDHVVGRNGPVTLRMAIADQPLTAELLIGQESPPLGWVSRRFDEKVPTACVRWAGRVEPGASWTTTIRVEFEPINSSAPR